MEKSSLSLSTVVALIKKYVTQYQSIGIKSVEGVAPGGIKFTLVDNSVYTISLNLTASGIIFTPVSGSVSNNVQAALEEIFSKLNEYNAKFEGYDNQFELYNNKFEVYDAKFLELDTNIDNTINDYLNQNLGTAIGDYLEGGGSIDLSQYAKEVDVNNAFNELATLLSGV